MQYWAFISYSHRDRSWGRWLHHSLETYRIPRQLIGADGRDGPIPRRLIPVFRDREELPSASDLGTTIGNALAQSRYIIVICSPRSAQSKWVNEEILNLKRMGRQDRILCLIVGGEPHASDQRGTEDLECFPEALRYEVDAETGELTDRMAEPIAADARMAARMRN